MIREANGSECLLELYFEETLNEPNLSCPCTKGGNTYKEYISGQISLMLISTW